MGESLPKIGLFEDKTWVSPKKPSYEYGNLITVALFVLFAMGFEYLVLAGIIGFRKVVRKELIILWSVVIYTVAVEILFGKPPKYLIGDVFCYLIPGWLIAGAVYLTYRIRKK